jgi:hypothetical protein
MWIQAYTFPALFTLERIKIQMIRRWNEYLDMRPQFIQPQSYVAGSEDQDPGYEVASYLM